jgi:hypothetical protein
MSGAAFLLSFACHLCGWLGIAPRGGKSVMLLHLGIFFTGVPLVILANRTQPKSSRRGNLEHLFAELPRWLRTLAMVLFVYALANFVFFGIQTRNYERGKVPFTLELRGFSGHWMLFYGWSAIGFVGLERFTRKQTLPYLTRVE